MFVSPELSAYFQSGCREGYDKLSSGNKEILSRLAPRVKQLAAIALKNKKELQQMLGDREYKWRESDNQAERKWFAITIQEIKEDIASCDRYVQNLISSNAGYSFHGRSIEELDRLSFLEFARLINPRISRTQESSKPEVTAAPVTADVTHSVHADPSPLAAALPAKEGVNPAKKIVTKANDSPISNRLLDPTTLTAIFIGAIGLTSLIVSQHYGFQGLRESGLTWVSSALGGIALAQTRVVTSGRAKPIAVGISILSSVAFMATKKSIYLAPNAAMAIGLASVILKAD